MRKIVGVLFWVTILCSCSSAQEVTQLEVELIPLDNCDVFFDNGIWAKKDSTNNYPNPFGPVTNLRFKVETDDSVKVYLTNSRGTQCWLALNEFLESGNYRLIFRNIEKSDVYVAKIFFSDHNAIKKLLFVK